MQWYNNTQLKHWLFPNARVAEQIEPFRTSKRTMWRARMGHITVTSMRYITSQPFKQPKELIYFQPPCPTPISSKRGVAGHTGAGSSQLEKLPLASRTAASVVPRVCSRHKCPVRHTGSVTDKPNYPHRFFVPRDRPATGDDAAIRSRVCETACLKLETT